MCPSGVTCLPTDCCFSELALLKSNSACWSSTKRISSTCHWKLTSSRHYIQCSWKIAELTLNNNHSLDMKNLWFWQKNSCWKLQCQIILLKTAVSDYFVENCSVRLFCWKLQSDYFVENCSDNHNSVDAIYGT